MIINATTREHAARIACLALEFSQSVRIDNVSGSETMFKVHFDETVVMSADELAALVRAAATLPPVAG